MKSVNPRRIRAVGFDFDHTLGIDNKLERVAFLQLLDRLCLQGGRCLGTLTQEIERIDALLADQRAGKFTIDEAVERFMQERGASDPRTWIDPYKRMCLDMVPVFVIPQPDARYVLQALRARQIPTAILTNGWSPLQQAKAERVGFDGPVVVSSDLGFQKPEARAFEAMSKALALPPEETAYVGDSPSGDVAGALAAGMAGIWLDAEEAHYPPDLPPPSKVIHTLTELLALM